VSLRPGLLALAFAWSCTVVATAHGAGLDRNLAEYQEIVGQYRSGDVTGAVRRIADWDGVRLIRAAQRFSAPKDPFPQLSRDGALAVSAACLLHLDVLARSPGRPWFEGLHLQVVRTHLGRLRGQDRPSPLAADLHLALAILLARQLKVEDLESFFGEVGETFGSDGPFLLAKGTLHELLASRRLEAARRASLVPGAKTSLDRAERFLRRAMAAAPALTEARLRLAHVVVLQGRPEEGIALLQPLLPGSVDPDTRYLASLFLGQAHAAAGRRHAAKEAFAVAATRPCGQVAAMALAHQDFLARDFAAAREALDATFEGAAGCRDPWPRYDYGQARNLPGLLDRLREAVRP
jgi:hypothetical protein